MSDVPQQIANDMTDEPTVTLYHGTNERGLRSIREEGALRSLDFAEVAAEVARWVDLPEGSVEDSQHYEFTRNRKHDDSVVYLSQNENTAISYAQGGGSEAYFDAFMAAYYLVYPDRANAYRDERCQEWVRAQLATLLGAPLVLTVEVPWSILDTEVENSANLSYDQWMQPTGRPYTRTTVMIKAPIPAEWITDIRPLD